MTEPSVLIVSPKRTRRPGAGRPRCKEPRSTVSVRIPQGDHDALIRIANAKDVSLAALVRYVLTRATGRK